MGRFIDSETLSFEQIKSSKAKTIEQFIEIHGGSEPSLESTLASMMAQVFVTFTFGLAMPILWPILLLILTNTYVVERIMCAYFYKRTPIFGNEVNDAAL